MGLALVTRNPRQSQALGALMGRLARPGDVVLLVGPLGAGKTCLVQGLARGLGVQDQVVSPTFTLVREYQGRIPLYHIDLFRIESTAEAQELGLEDYLGGQGLCAVEWADRAMEALPQEHLLVTLDYQGERERLIYLEAYGSRYEALLKGLQRKRRARAVRAS